MEFDKFCVSGLQGSGFLGLRLRVSIWGVLHCFCEKTVLLSLESLRLV